MSIEQLKQEVAEEFTTADILELANKFIDILKVHGFEIKED